MTAMGSTEQSAAALTNGFQLLNLLGSVSRSNSPGVSTVGQRLARATIKCMFDASTSTYTDLAGGAGINGVRFDLALALLCAGERSRAFLEYSRGVHQAVNGGVERLRGCLRVALDDLEESLTERPALATTREAIAARDLLRSTLRAAYQAG